MSELQGTRILDRVDEVSDNDREFNRRYEAFYEYLGELREATFLGLGAEGEDETEMARKFDVAALKKSGEDWQERVQSHMEKCQRQLKAKDKKDEDLAKHAEKSLKHLEDRGAEISGKAAKKFLYNKLSYDVNDCVATITKAERAKVIPKTSAGSLRRMATNWDWKLKKNAKGKGRLSKELEMQMNAADILIPQ